MTVFASLSPGLGSTSPATIVWARIMVPMSGLFTVDLSTTDVVEVTGPQTFTLDTLSLTCTATRVYPEIGRTGVRLVGGQAGWRNASTVQQYTNALMSTIVSDTASTVGEAVPVLATDGEIPSYFRSTDPASQVLDDLLGASWWMQPSGVVTTSPQSTAPITSGFQCMKVDGAVGRFTMGVDVVADWTPGRSFANSVVSGTIVRVTHLLEEGSVRTEILAA